MVTHSSIPAWRIPRTEEPGGLQSMGSRRVRHNRAINTFTFKHVHNNILSDLFKMILYFSDLKQNNDQSHDKLFLNQQEFSHQEDFLE